VNFFTDQRHTMVEEQIAARGVRDDAILAAMREVPREAFVPEEMTMYAHEDRPVPIGNGHTIPEPYVIAAAIEALQLEPTDRVLEMSSGSGYAAAILSRIAGEVYAVERLGDLARAARARFDDLGYDNISVRHGDAVTGWPEAAPFDAIIAPAGPDVVETLRSQLAVGGRLVVPIASHDGELRLLRVTRVDDARFHDERLDPMTAAAESKHDN